MTYAKWCLRIGDKIKTGDCRKPVYIETDNESHDECNHELFCVTKESLNPKY